MIGARLNYLLLLNAEDELGATQQGLDKSGVRMPNFAGLNKAMGGEPAPETAEQREFRRIRLLASKLATNSAFSP